MGGRRYGTMALSRLVVTVVTVVTVVALTSACTTLPFGNGEGESALRANQWEWIAGGMALMPQAVAIPARYTIDFQAEHRVAVRADCNRGIGPWRLDGGRVKIGPLSMSKRICGADSRGREFQVALEATGRWYIRDDALFLELPNDRGMLRLAARSLETAP